MRRENKQNEETSKPQSLGKIDRLKKNGILEEGLSLSNIFENLVGKEEKMIIKQATQNFQMNIVSQDKLVGANWMNIGQEWKISYVMSLPTMNDQRIETYTKSFPLTTDICLFTLSGCNCIEKLNPSKNLLKKQ